MTNNFKFWIKYWKELKPCHQCLQTEHLDIMYTGTDYQISHLICHYCDFDIRSKAKGQYDAANRLKAKWNALYDEKTTKLQRLLAGQE
jgi:hypothetical protein